jgi:hypothetical protein
MSELLEEIVAQDDGLVVLAIARAVDERDGTVLRSIGKRLPGLWIGVELSVIALHELIPACGIVAETLTQRGARRDIAQPSRKVQRILRDAARPEPIDEKACALVIAGRVIGPRKTDSDVLHRITYLAGHLYRHAATSHLSQRCVEHSRGGAVALRGQRHAENGLPVMPGRGGRVP